MPAGLQFGYGTQRLLDAFQRYTRAAHPIYYRYKLFADPQSTSQAAAMGFSVSPSGSVPTGTNDILLDPPPSYSMVSIHNIGMSAGKLRFGARMFIVSQSVTSGLQTQLNLASQELVWRGSQIVGLVTDNLLFSVEDYKHGELAGATIVWELTCNSNEIR